jgi:adenine/guanine phosphoribosyltransferase-like PRPP-binding protein
MMGYPVGESLPYSLPTIHKMAKVLEKKQYHNLGLVCTGSSGAIIAGIIASKLKPTPKIFYIKKKYERNHGHGTWELTNCENLVFVDDFIYSGSTVKHVIRQLRMVGINKIKAVFMVFSNCLKTKYILKFSEEQLYLKSAKN